MSTFFQLTMVKFNATRWCYKALVKDFFPQPRRPCCWLVPETTRFHSTVSCEVEHCKSRSFPSYFLKKMKQLQHSKMSWCNVDGSFCFSLSCLLERVCFHHFVCCLKMFHCWSLNEVLAVMVTWGLEGHYGLALLASSSVSGDLWELSC